MRAGQMNIPKCTTHVLTIFPKHSLCICDSRNLLRISHSKSKVLKAILNRPDIKMNFSQHRIYILLRAKLIFYPRD
ncbi:hypothetical protein NQ314_007661 [Rhamnusium bicolor]|uniref:Uncharacterized protein n=1 Tax=Rhamnusium bicolor TaxID=1586634 RepID=A0AAV8YLE1_9CUCU|nr:hypothetical protein NQ314_007661 [Rhamnusium bicolor]